MMTTYDSWETEQEDSNGENRKMKRGNIGRLCTQRQSESIGRNCAEKLKG